MRGRRHAGDTGLVIQVTRADEAYLADLNPRVEGHEIADVDPQPDSLRFRLSALVQPHLDGGVLALQAGNLLTEHVVRPFGQEQRAANGFPTGCEYGAPFTLDRIPRVTA